MGQCPDSLGPVAIVVPSSGGWPQGWPRAAALVMGNRGPVHIGPHADHSAIALSRVSLTLFYDHRSFPSLRCRRRHFARSQSAFHSFPP